MGVYASVCAYVHLCILALAEKMLTRSITLRNNNLRTIDREYRPSGWFASTRDPLRPTGPSRGNSCQRHDQKLNHKQNRVFDGTMSFQLTLI